MYRARFGKLVAALRKGLIESGDTFLSGRFSTVRTIFDTWPRLSRRTPAPTTCSRASTSTPLPAQSATPTGPSRFHRKDRQMDVVVKPAKRSLVSYASLCCQSRST